MNTIKPSQDKTVEKKKQYADFDQLSNDLFWSFYHSEYSEDYKEHHFEKIKWTGYNDSYWWNTVSPEQTKRTCKCGKVFEIDFRTNEVNQI